MASITLIEYADSGAVLSEQFTNTKTTQFTFMDSRYPSLWSKLAMQFGQCLTKRGEELDHIAETSPSAEASAEVETWPRALEILQQNDILFQTAISDPMNAGCRRWCHGHYEYAWLAPDSLRCERASTGFSQTLAG